MEPGVEGVPHTAPPLLGGRLDGHRDYISCSVQVPNAWLLDAYRENGHHTDEWIVLLLTPELLQQPSTRFSPVNAATAFGAHVTDGPDGLEAMFQQRPPSVNPIWRCQKHARSCPTDNQAEALVHQAIFTDEIIGIVCMTPESQQHVDRLHDSWDDPKPVTSVRDLLFDPHVLKHRIWNGDDIDLPVRGEND